MGYATTRTAERVAAALGKAAAAPIQFGPAHDVPKGGVLLALPALLAVGLLRHTAAMYQLPKGFYGIASIFLLLALQALARVKSIEQLRYVAPGEWQSVGAGPYSGGADATAEVGDLVPGGGARHALEYGTGQGVDRRTTRK